VDLTRYFEAGTGDIDFAIAQAEGMISAQADIPIASAQIALDEYCREHGETRHAVAAQVTEGWLRFDQ
jgi:hypothetical protein